MIAYRALWTAAVVFWAVLGLIGSLTVMSPGHAAAFVVAVGALGAVSGYACARELPAVRHPVWAGALLPVAVLVLMPGVVQLLGGIGIAVIAALVVTAPPVASRIGVRLAQHRRRLDDGATAACQPPPTTDDGLSRQWIESTKLLDAARSPAERLSIVEVRSQILDDLVERWQGRVPDCVWRSVETSEPGPTRRAGARRGRGSRTGRWARPGD